MRISLFSGGTVWGLPVFFLGIILFATPSFSQSLPYRTLLSTLYDRDFPVVKSDQVTDISEYQILDAREKEEFEVSHLPKALWIGYDTFSLKNIAGLDKNQPVLVYCTVGARSQDIGKKLQKAGFTKVFNLYGGIIQWANEGRSLEAAGKPTQKVHTYTRTWGIWLTRGEKVY
ncbi:Rhodanese-related sulfurtransferase [Algoriphagus alkaliphilus]|uniref:Rhodanese-related sulfurtransferase n=1 Tax=Algoriphagus alkaliphilus TaxID=279824 RepID=A0A1G5WWN1_9BACT|nr:rhodanese-like domain-containing protein [Algoriphagus alkaliphilus]SDA62304.1 Rhodanese-related sulfurtransferase [Algoriphagus alkaliphilus]